MADEAIDMFGCALGVRACARRERSIEGEKFSELEYRPHTPGRQRPIAVRKVGPGRLTRPQAAHLPKVRRASPPGMQAAPEGSTKTVVQPDK